MIESRLIDFEPYMRSAATILLHSLWQGILIGLLTAIALSLIGRSNARIRYAVSCGAMLAVIIAAVVTAIAIRPGEHVAADSVSAVSDELIGGRDNSDVDATYSIVASAMDVPTSSRRWQQPSISRYILIFWFAGVMLFSSYHLMGWLRARGYVRRGASPVPPEWQEHFERLRDRLKIKRMASLLASSIVKVPCVVGWMKPVVLVPVGLFTSLEPSEIEMILVHELAHVRRYDVLINLMQSAMETLFFFNPAVWWISRQIRTEREDCCDDTAILRAGSRLRYARALANLEELRMFKTNIGTAISDAPLRRRIQRIVGIPRTPFYSAMLSFTGMLLCAFFILVVLGPLGISNDSVLHASENTLSEQTLEPESGGLRGKWETEMDGDHLKILVYGRESSGMSYVLALGDVTDLIGQKQEPFQIIRDAGTLFLEGRLAERDGKVDGNGNWYFLPDTAYMRFMSRYGLRDNDRQKTFSLAIRDISREYLAELEDRGYHDLTVDQLISAGVFDISPELVDEYRQIGYTYLTYQQLLSMQVQGVTPNDARRFQRLGVGHLTPEQLISARIQGITPEYIESFRKSGFHELTFKNFCTLHAFNLDVDDFEDCYRHRFMDLSEENMVWVCGFGITQNDVEEMQERGYTDIDSIIRMLAKDAGK